MQEGMTYPQLEVLNLDQFKAYYLAGEAFVAKLEVRTLTDPLPFQSQLRSERW